MTPAKRGLLGTVLDRLYARWLSPETNNYTIDSLRIPIADNVSIAADLYRPLGPNPLGTIFVRSPYSINLSIALPTARIFAARGYQVLLSSCRGTSDSEGDFDPARNEGRDGQVVLAWMREQPWYTGSFATLGASYLGYVQWALLSANPPPDMKAAIINTGPHDFSHFVYGTGALACEVIAWSDFITRMRRGQGTISLLWYLRSQKARLLPLYNAVPLLDAVNKYFGLGAPKWIQDMITHTDLSDSYWQPMRVQTGALDQSSVPILLTTGWYDLVLPEVMEQYSRLSAGGGNVALTIGPWTHLGAGGANSLSETLSWLEEHLAQRPGAHRPSPVRIFVTGKQEWRDFPSWPPPSSPHELFLSPANTLSRDPPPADAPDSVFKFDPADPTPSLGAPELYDQGRGKREPDTALATRPDTLTFATAPLPADLAVIGKPLVTLHHASDHPHVDVLVLLSEVQSDGVSHSISERYLRLDRAREQQGGPDPLLRLALRDCAHVFCKGNRIRLLIAGGSHPRYIRNLGTEENPGTSANMCAAWHTVKHSGATVSKIGLPVADVATLS
ncbi:X-Pro dipeptidyl-peptidase-domain-containing protein [Lasiosphaeria hispida]|uniref:X-Pro dipeptidyl-peptidase-domain-containing protein n=1 Tax=Lasiosphaeria hispida TaxID=260671 RepID=A0AAJ0M884_9PEZI|nr:X-Pro dipeptidyl-peptidase-domain-containing protein [Lasiosphaeria hispida]